MASEKQVEKLRLKLISDLTTEVQALLLAERSSNLDKRRVADLIGVIWSLKQLSQKSTV